MSEGFVSTKIGKRFTVVIPQEIRKHLPIKEGDEILVKTDGKVIIIALQENDFAEQLEALIGDVVFDRDARKKALDYSLKLTDKRE